MQIEGIEHIQLAMPSGQEDADRKFYSGLLEIPEVPKPPELAKRGGVWFENGRVKVHLGIMPSSESSPHLSNVDTAPRQRNWE